MNKWILHLTWLFAASAAHADSITDNGLIKVNAETKSKCVEYFEYKGETYCSTKPTANLPNDIDAVKEAPHKIIFDDRLWKAVWVKKDDHSITIEYVPNGDDINNWKELVTSQTYYGLQSVPPKKFADAFIESLKEKNFQPKVTVHQSSEKREVFEFQIKDPASQEQDVIIVVSTGKDALYVLQYAIKKFDMGNAMRQLWIKNLTQSTHQ